MSSAPIGGRLDGLTSGGADWSGLRVLVAGIGLSGFAAAEVEFRVPVPEADRLQGPPEVAWRPTGDDKDAIVSLARTVGEHADTLNKLLFTYLDYAVIARKA